MLLGAHKLLDEPRIVFPSVVDPWAHHPIPKSPGAETEPELLDQWLDPDTDRDELPRPWHHMRSIVHNPWFEVHAPHDRDPSERRCRHNHASLHPYSGLTWAAASGASMADLMHRGGHANPRAALRYQHATY